MKSRHDEIIKLLKKNTMMKINELCDHLQVSAATIRRDLNELQDRGVQRVGGGAVLKADAASKHAYPAISDQSPKQFGCILSIRGSESNHPYFSKIIEGIEHELHQYDYSLSHKLTSHELSNTSHLHQILTTNQIDGMIAIEGVQPDIYAMIKQHVPVIVGIDISDHAVPVIAYDRINAAKSAVRHLLDQGHQEIGFIGGAGLTGDLKLEKRYRGYQYALQEAGIDVNPAWVIDANWQVETSYKRMLQLLQQPHRPTAMFAASDMMAFSAMRAVNEQKLRIPEDIAFIGLDNIELSEYTTPPLSSIDIPKYEMGRVAARTMLDFLNGVYRLPFKMFLPYEIIVRQSSNYMRSPSK